MRNWYALVLGHTKPHICPFPGMGIVTLDAGFR